MISTGHNHYSCVEAKIFGQIDGVFIPAEYEFANICSFNVFHNILISCLFLCSLVGIDDTIRQPD